jgi:hypothetical protein
MTWKKIENFEKEDSIFFCMCIIFMDKWLLNVVFLSPFVGIVKVLKSFVN